MIPNAYQFLSYRPSQMVPESLVKEPEESMAKKRKSLPIGN